MFDDVTLVGVINADTQLHLPDYRAGERTFQLIEQVAGRAGRAELDGRVMVQTYEADDVAIRAAATYNRGMFLRAELPKRKLLGYSPYVRMANVLLWGADEHAVATEAELLHAQLAELIRNEVGERWQVLPGRPLRAGEAAQHLPLPHRREGAFGRRPLGPAGAPVPRPQGEPRRQRRRRHRPCGLAVGPNLTVLKPPSMARAILSFTTLCHRPGSSYKTRS